MPWNEITIAKMLEKRKNTCLAKYGCEHPMKSKRGMDNFKKSIKEKYGVEHYSKTDDFKNKSSSKWTLEKIQIKNDKTKQTCINKYGIDNPSKLSINIDKIKRTKLKRYNDPTYNNRDKAIKTCIKKYGYPHHIHNKNIQLKILNTRTKNFLNGLFSGNRLDYLLKPLFDPSQFVSVQEYYPFECSKCHTIFKSNIEDGKIPKCPACFSRNNISFPELEFLDYLKIEDRQKYIKPFKVDGCKNKKIFEFLGDFWHGNPIRFDKNNYNKIVKKTFGELYDNTIYKFRELYQMGYTIYYVWENDWNLWINKKRQTFPIKKFKFNNYL
jgi:hypothetical protein